MMSSAGHTIVTVITDDRVMPVIMIYHPTSCDRAGGQRRPPGPFKFKFVCHGSGLSVSQCPSLSDMALPGPAAVTVPVTAGGPPLTRSSSKFCAVTSSCAPGHAGSESLSKP